MSVINSQSSNPSAYTAETRSRRGRHSHHSQRQENRHDSRHQRHNFQHQCQPQPFNQQPIQEIIDLIQQLIEQLQQQQPETEYRSFDGSGNNQQNPHNGQTESELLRILPQDTSREPGGTTETGLSSPREISNAVASQTESIANEKGLSDMFWLWGQFLDHDITLVHANSGEDASISVPEGDPHFDPQGTGTATIGFTRSDSVTDAAGNRQQINRITSFIDGSNVYGSDKATADSLRTFEGGKMRISTGNLLPTDEQGNFIAGDVRANEHAGLTSMHTLWMREHNQVAEQLASEYPEWNDEKIYQEARSWVSSEIQAITYNEFIPALLGDNALPEYQGYNDNLSADISNAFSAAAFRLGHTMLSPTLLRLDENGNEIAEGNLSLRDAFFQPDNVSAAGIDPILRGFAAQTAQAVDPFIVDDVRNFLFGQPGQGGFDLASLNLQRGRDHGLPSLNEAREALGLSRIESFSDPIWRDDVGAKLAQVYDSPDEVDLWIGGLAEDNAGDSLVGDTFSSILTDQFTRLRDADRFWYENTHNQHQINQLNNTSLSDIIARNTGVDDIQDNAFMATRGAAQFPPVQAAADGSSGDSQRMSAGSASMQFAPQDQGKVVDQMMQQMEQIIQAIRDGLLG